MSSEPNVRAVRAQLEAGTLAPDAALATLQQLAHTAPIRAIRIDAYRVLGDIAGRAFDAPWDTAEKAAWALLTVARHTDAPVERSGLILAMGRGFRNVWLMPFVHSRLADDDPMIVEAAIHAAGGLGFAALEEALSSAFLGDEARHPLRLAAIEALGRMGAMSAVGKLVPLISADPDEAAATLTALTEIRSPAGADAAAALLDRGPERAVLIAGVRYLSEMGRLEVLPHLRRMAREEDAELRQVAGFASRALKAERSQDAGERILVALTERDRAVRAVLARRLRTVPVAQILEQAEMLLSDDPEGVVQVLGEMREPEITRYLLAASAKPELPMGVRARAIGSVEASEAWEREALAKVIATSKDDPVRAAAARTMGAFATLAELFKHLGPLATDPSAELRGAFLWALQLAARPSKLTAAERKRCEEELRRALKDEDPLVRRRAAYVAGNLQLDGLAPDLVTLAKAEDKKADLRVAAFVGLGELASPAVFTDVLALLRREEDPQALAAASRAVAFTVLGSKTKLEFAHLHGKIAHLLKDPDPVVREAAVRLAGLTAGGVPAALVVPLARDAAPRVREEALTALGRLASPEAEKPLLDAFEDVDPGVHERAAEALLTLGGKRALEQVLEYVAGEESPAARGSIASRIKIPATESAHFMPRVNSALGKLDADDPAYEPLLGLKVTLLEQSRPDKPGATGGNVDASINALFPTYAQLAKVRGFDQLGRSLRTAEALYGSTTGLSDADLSPPIVLWMKSMEGYVHAWLSGKLQQMQREPMALFEHVDHLLVDSWPTYQRFVGERWKDSVDVGATKVDVPLRSLSNVLREFQERRPKRLDSPLSVTEWARMMVFFAVDHPSGVRNAFKVSSKNADQVVRLAHKLHTLAAVRNVVTHRAAAGSATLEAFRRAYYAAFEELTKLA